MEHVRTARPDADEMDRPTGAPASWRERALAWAGYGLLAVVVACVGAMSWTGLVGWSEDTLRMDGPARALVPASLDAAAMACAFLALRSVTAGDSAGGARVLLVAFVAASAAINYRHAEAAYGDPAAALFFGGMSVAAVAMWDLVLRQLRRATLRQIGALERPLPRFRLLRWIPGIAFRETWAAWRVSIRRGLSRPEDALAIVWAQPAPVLTITGSLDGLSKADAVRAAFAELGAADVPAALTWLAERGVEVDRSYAYDVARRQAVPLAHPELGQAAA